MEENIQYIVYVKVNNFGYITSVISSEFIEDISDWIEIDRGSGVKYYHAQSRYFPKRIRTNHGAYHYKLIGGIPVECSAEEIVAQEEAIMNPVPRASHNIITGEYITVNGAMYKAIANIPNGEPIITGQNVVKTTIEEQLYGLMKGE